MSKSKNSSPQPSPHSRPVASIPSSPRLQALAGVALILVAVVLAYLPALRGDFLLDDLFLLTDNPLIQAPDGLSRFWCTTESQDYWPVTNTTLWLEWRLWGMNPAGYHLTNLILHIAASLLMWAILRKLSIPGAFLATLLFAVHPVNVESVAWISQRKNMLAMFFFLLSILWYLKQFSTSCSDNAQRNRHAPSAAPAHGVCGPLIGPWYWLSLLAFLLAMLSKGSVAPLPLLLLGIVWWRRMGTVPIRHWRMGLPPSVSRWDIVRTMPFFIIAVVLTGVNLWFQTHGSGEVIRTASFAQRLLGAGGVLWFYLYKALLPLNLCFVYPEWHIQVGNLLWWLPLVGAVALTAVLWCYRKSWGRPFLVAWGFFCVSLLPVLGFTDVGFMKYSLVSDHYQHLALLGVMALVAAGWCGWRERLRGRAHLAADVAAVVVVAILTLLACQQSRLYRNAITLYQATLQKNPDSSWVHNNLGSVLLEAGRVQAAIKYFEQALHLNPDFAEAHNNLAGALNALGQYLTAIEHAQQALRLKSDYAPAHNNLGSALVEVGRTQEAIKHLTQALRLKPDLAEAHYNLGLALTKTGLPLEAIKHYEQALRLKPDYAPVYNKMGSALLEVGRTREAFEHYKQALRLKPDYAEVYYNLGNALINMGRAQEAIKHFEQALRLKPDYVEALNNLGIALASVGRTQEAIEHFQQALRFQPNDAETHNNLGIALVNIGRAQQAIEQFLQALRIKPDYPDAYANLAAAYAETNRPTDAIAAAQKALELARSKGQTTLAKQLEDWLTSYRAEQVKPPP